MNKTPVQARRSCIAEAARFPSPPLPPPLVLSRVPHDRSFFSGDVPDITLCRTLLLKLVRFSYDYVLSLCLCDYFSRKLHAKFEFPHLKARYVLFFHRKEFRRKNIREAVQFLHQANLVKSMTVIFKYNLFFIIGLGTCN